MGGRQEFSPGKARADGHVKGWATALPVPEPVSNGCVVLVNRLLFRLFFRSRKSAIANCRRVEQGLPTSTRRALPGQRSVGAVLTLMLLLVAGMAAQATGPAPAATTTVAAKNQPSEAAVQSESDPSAVEPAGAGGITRAAVEAARHVTTAAKSLPAKYDINKIGDRGIGNGLDFYSLARERALGQQLSAQVMSQARIVNDPVIADYVNRVTQNLVRHSDAKVPFVVRVIDDDEINAFSLPGGYLFVNTGLLQTVSNEAQLAGVLAHEIAHVAARHATKNATRMQIFNLASIPLIFVSGPAIFMAREVAGVAVPMSFLKFSRDAEREADLLGLEYSYSAGYDPTEFLRFFEIMKARQKQKVSFIARAFMSHPMTGDRIVRARNEIAEYLPPRNEYIVTTSDFVRMKNELAKLAGDGRINQGPTDHPVLRRRLPNQSPDEKASSKDDDRPVLRKRFGE